MPDKLTRLTDEERADVESLVNHSRSPDIYPSDPVVVRRLARALDAERGEVEWWKASTGNAEPCGFCEALWDELALIHAERDAARREAELQHARAESAEKERDDLREARCPECHEPRWFTVRQGVDGIVVTYGDCIACGWIHEQGKGQSDV